MGCVVEFCRNALLQLQTSRLSTRNNLAVRAGIVLAELLALLSGRPSSLFDASPPEAPTTYIISPAYTQLFHPGEVAALERLGVLAFRYAAIRRWIAQATRPPPPVAASSSSFRLDARRRQAGSSQNDEDCAPTLYLICLYATLQDLLKEYDALVIETQAKIVRRDEQFVAHGSIVTLSSLLAHFSPWQHPMASIFSLMKTLTAGTADPTLEDGTSSVAAMRRDWPPGILIDLLHARRSCGFDVIATLHMHLSRAVQRAWSKNLVAFLIHGLTSDSPESLVADAGNDPLSPGKRIYVFREGAMPSFVGPTTRESILYVGTAVATVRAQEGSKELPQEMRKRMADWVQRVRPEDEVEFARIIERVRAEVGEWLWTNVLTRPAVRDAIQDLGDFFLMRDGELGLGFVREIEDLKFTKLIRSNLSLASSVIREQDIRLALLRASVGTRSEQNPTLERIRFNLEKGPLRPFLSTLSSSTSAFHASTSGMGTPDLFASHLLGTPVRATFTVPWPLDLFLTPAATSVYSLVFSYLAALRRTHTRVLACWLGLSGAQRTRRRWTSVGEGGAEEAEARKRLARQGWGMVRLMLWFLDSVIAHFQMDVIEVQHLALLDKLQEGWASSVSTAPNDAPSSPISLIFPTPSSRRFPPTPRIRTHSNPTSSQLPPSRPGSPHSASSPRTAAFPASPSAIPPSPTLSSGPGASVFAHSGSSSSPALDFITLRAAHGTYLDLLADGLLLSAPDREAASTLRDILGVCEQFVAYVERWGGDVLPGLLAEGYDDEAGSNVGALVAERSRTVQELREDLNGHLETFFDLLTPSSSSSASAANATINQTFSAAGGAGDASFAPPNAIQSLGPGAFARSTSSKAAAAQGAGKKKRGGGQAAAAAARADERQLEAEVSARRHREQLALRLDFGGWFGRREAEDYDEEGAALEEGQTM